MPGLELQTGTPSVDGRYVVFTPCKSRQIADWCEPHIATWTGGKWIFFDPIAGWIGPLPVVHNSPKIIVAHDEADFVRQYEGREYDL